MPDNNKKDNSSSNSRLLRLKRFSLPCGWVSSRHDDSHQLMLQPLVPLSAWYQSMQSQSFFLYRPLPLSVHWLLTLSLSIHWPPSHSLPLSLSLWQLKALTATWRLYQTLNGNSYEWTAAGVTDTFVLTGRSSDDEAHLGMVLRRVREKHRN